MKIDYYIQRLKELLLNDIVRRVIHKAVSISVCKLEKINAKKEYAEVFAQFQKFNNILGEDEKNHLEAIQGFFDDFLHGVTEFGEKGYIQEKALKSKLDSLRKFIKKLDNKLPCAVIDADAYFGILMQSVKKMGSFFVYIKCIRHKADIPNNPF